MGGVARGCGGGATRETFADEGSGTLCRPLSVCSATDKFSIASSPGSKAGVTEGGGAGGLRVGGPPLLAGFGADGGGGLAAPPLPGLGGIVFAYIKRAQQLREVPDARRLREALHELLADRAEALLDLHCGSPAGALCGGGLPERLLDVVALLDQQQQQQQQQQHSERLLVGS